MSKRNFIDKKIEINQYYQFFLKENTDSHPGIPCSEAKFIEWARINLGHTQLTRKVLNKLKKEGLIKD